MSIVSLSAWCLVNSLINNVPPGSPLSKATLFLSEENRKQNTWITKRLKTRYYLFNIITVRFKLRTCSKTDRMSEYFSVSDIREQFSCGEEVRDIVKRLGVVTAEQIRLKKHPIKKPVTIFNPAILKEGENIRVFGRIVLGYFTYTSAVVEFTIPINDFTNQGLTKRDYTAEITVYPNNDYDWWGVEDPRVYRIDDKKLMTYCGRTINYFEGKNHTEKTVPITAIYENGQWRKLFAFRMPERLRDIVISNKNAFVVKAKNGLNFFYRIHMKDNVFYMMISDLQEDIFSFDNFTEISSENVKCVIKPTKYEDKLGWGPAPIKVGNEYLFFIHAVKKTTKSYVMGALLMDENLDIVSMTPYYIMEPKELYEIFGDRSYTIFPCGAELIDDKIMISYGAADSCIGFGEIDLSEIMSMLDSHRL